MTGTRAHGVAAKGARRKIRPPRENLHPIGASAAKDLHYNLKLVQTANRA